MKHVKENVVVALLLAALIVVAFWGIELSSSPTYCFIVVIACLAFMPAFWERIDRKKGRIKRHS